MIIAPAALNDVGHAIQLALAPVFLLTGIAGTLNVMTGRLARIIDRGRQIAHRSATEHLDEEVATELLSLERRRYLASAAITATTFSALLVCMVVTALFLDVLLAVNLNLLVGMLFAGSSLALVVGLAYFLREVHLATKTVRIPAVRVQPRT
jgi:Protein of unknown function (DUF2721)